MRLADAVAERSGSAEAKIERRLSASEHYLITVDGRLLHLAAAVISKADRSHPADQVLRDALKGAGRLDAEAAARVVGMVFGYYRWRGWVDARTPLLRQIEHTVQLAAKFARAPEQFPEEELKTRAIPAWTNDEMTVDAAWVRSLQNEPRLWLRARREQGPGLAAKLGHCRVLGAGPLADALEYQGDEDLFRSPEFHAGDFEVQDLASQLVGLICAPGAGETWWDACAGEGGKTLHLSDLMNNRGLIWASDRAGWRLQKLKRRAARARVFNYRAAIWDGGAKLPTRARFDGVLVDAPCSGVGTWQRNPHARWTTGPEDVRELAALQAQLLARAAGAVKPGGRLVYAVCTLTRSETTEIAAAFERQFGDFEPGAIAIPEKLQAAPSAQIYLRPQELGSNGMFVAVWKRRPPPASGSG